MEEGRFTDFSFQDFAGEVPIWPRPYDVLRTALRPAGSVASMVEQLQEFAAAQERQKLQEEETEALLRELNVSVYQEGGPVRRLRGRDTVPAMLEEGEFVVTKQAAQLYPDELMRMNLAGYLGDQAVASLEAASLKKRGRRYEQFYDTVAEGNEQVTRDMLEGWHQIEDRVAEATDRSKRKLNQFFTDAKWNIDDAWTRFQRFLDSMPEELDQFLSSSPARQFTAFVTSGFASPLPIPAGWVAGPTAGTMVPAPDRVSPLTNQPSQQLFNPTNVPSTGSSLLPWQEAATRFEDALAGRTQGFQGGGFVRGRRRNRRDSVLAMLEPGEFVVSRPVAERFPAELTRLNLTGQLGGVNATTVNLTVNVAGDVRDPKPFAEKIARLVDDAIRRRNSRIYVTGSASRG
jgi:hypothetical protein